MNEWGFKPIAYKKYYLAMALSYFSAGTLNIICEYTERHGTSETVFGNIVFVLYLLVLLGSIFLWIYLGVKSDKQDEMFIENRAKTDREFLKVISILFVAGYLAVMFFGKEVCLSREYLFSGFMLLVGGYNLIAFKNEPKSDEED